MTVRNALFVLSALLAALLLALLLRGTAGVPTAETEAAGAVPEAAETNPEAAQAGRRAPSPLPEACPGGTTTLHGLRLLTDDRARERGWTPPAQDPNLEVIQGAWTRLMDQEISVRYVDTPIGDVCRDLLTRYRIDIRIDPAVPADLVRVTFRVDDLSAAQCLDLMMKMWREPRLPEPQSIEECMRDEDGLALTIDEHGLYWIRLESQVVEIDPVRLAVNRMRDLRSPETTIEEESAAGVAGRSATASLVHRPLQEVAEALLKSAGVRHRGWTREAEALLQRAPEVSVIGENLPLGPTLDGLLGPAGLALAADSRSAVFLTREQFEELAAERRAEIAVAQDEVAERARLARRPVRIRGELLRLADILAQIADELKIRTVIHPDLADDALHWESDGMVQSAGEVLDILARDAGLGWRCSLDDTGSVVWIWGKEH